MTVKIYDKNTGWEMFVCICDEQPTLFKSLTPAFGRFDIDKLPLQKWINQKKDGHYPLTIQGPKYMAKLTP